MWRAEERRGALVVLLTCGAAACSTARVPDFPMRALSGPHVLRAKLGVSAAGQITKYTVYVRKEGLPPWVHAQADETLGRGEDLEYEVELYANGSQVYELTRRVGGEVVELSVQRDGSLEYVERVVALEDLPTAVSERLNAVEGFVPGEAFRRRGPAIDDYSVDGERSGAARRVRLLPNGTLVSINRRLPGTFEIAE